MSAPEQSCPITDIMRLVWNINIIDIQTVKGYCLLWHSDWIVKAEYKRELNH